MDLGEPLAAVLPRLHARVLRALLSTSGRVTGGQVHRLAGMGSDNGVRAVLSSLVEQGLVLAEPAGRAVLYSVNPDHVLYQPLATMSRARGEIVDRLAAQIQSWSAGIPAWHASVFGSFARGDADAGSDVDVLVVLDPDVGADLNDERWTAQTGALARKIQAWTGNAGQVVELDVEGLGRLVKADDPLVASWRADAVHLTGLPLLQLLREVRARSGVPARPSGTPG